MMVVGMVCAQALYGAGANTYVMIAEGLLHFGVLVPLAWLFGPYLGLGSPGSGSATRNLRVRTRVCDGRQIPGQGLAKIEL